MTIVAAWKALLAGLAGAAGLIICGILIVTLADVFMRSFGFQPPLWKATFVEFGLLYAAILSAPWIASRDGNIRLRTLKALPLAFQSRAERAVMALLGGLCLVLAWHASTVVADAIRYGEFEMRSVGLPRWVLLAAIAPGFRVTALEVWGQASMGPDGRA